MQEIVGWRGMSDTGKKRSASPEELEEITRSLRGRVSVSGW